MTSPINLGNTQMCEHGLGSMIADSQGGWAGSGFTGRVSLMQRSITVKNPAGSVLLAGFADFTLWTSVVGSVIQGSVVVDGGAQALFSKLAFNKAGEHVQFSFGWYAGYVNAGAHALDLGVYVAAGSINFDGQDGGTFAAWERA